MNTLKNKAENIYLKELKIIEKLKIPGTTKILGSGLTYGGELAKLGKKLFGNKFKGVYASNEVKDLKETDKGYFIFNLDKRDEPGSHWLGIVKTPKGIMIYDSFGRPSKQIIPSVFTLGHSISGKPKLRITDTEDDAEQLITEENCGSRAMSFLKVYDDYGPEIASLI